MVSGNVRKDVNSRAGNIDRTFPVATVLLTSLRSPIAHHSPKSQTPWIGRDKGLREDNDLYSLAGRPCGQGSNFLQSALPIKGNRGSLQDGSTNALYLCCHSFFSCYLLSFEETCSYLSVAIAARHQHTAAMTNPLPGSVSCGDVKRPTGAYSHFAQVGALVCPARDHRPHQIAGLEAFDALALLGAGARKTVLIHATHLPAPMPRRT